MSAHGEAPYANVLYANSSNPVAFSCILFQFYVLALGSDHLILEGGGVGRERGRFKKKKISQNMVKHEKNSYADHASEKNSKDKIDQNIVIHIFIGSQMILMEGSNGKCSIKIRLPETDTFLIFIMAFFMWEQWKNLTYNKNAKSPELFTVVRGASEQSH